MIEPGMVSVSTAEPPQRVVLVHGLWLNGSSMQPLARRLSRHGFAGRQFAYPSTRADIYAHAAALSRYLDALDGPAHLVAHSLGGLVILRMFERSPPARIGRVVLLGSPLRPSRAGTALARWRWGRSLLGGSALPGGVLGPDCADLRAEQQIGIVAGGLQVGLGRLLTRFDGPNDGTVAVEETRLAGAADSVVLPVSHFGLLLAPSVAEQTAHFLRHGRFKQSPTAY